MQQEYSSAIKVTPAIGGATLAGLTANDWVAVVTFLYVLAQFGLLLPKYWALARAKGWVK